MPEIDAQQPFLVVGERPGLAGERAALVHPPLDRLDVEPSTVETERVELDRGVGFQVQPVGIADVARPLAAVGQREEIDEILEPRLARLELDRSPRAERLVQRQLDIPALIGD